MLTVENTDTQNEGIEDWLHFHYSGINIYLFLDHLRAWFPWYTWG